MTLRSPCRTLVILLVLVCPALAAAQDDALPTLTLDEARELLLANSDDVELAERAAERAELYIDRARSLLRPTVQVTGSYTLYDREIEFELGNPYEPLIPYLDAVRAANPDNPDLFDPSVLAQGGEPATIQPRHEVRGGLTVSQSLFNARAFPLLQQAYLVIDQADNGVDQTRYQLGSVLEQAWFMACTLRRFVDIAEGQEEIARLTHERLQGLFDEGVGNLFEVRRALLDYNNAEREAENARRSYRIAVEAVAALLDVPSDFDVAEPAQLEVPATLDEVLESYEQRLPQFEGHDLAVEFSEEQLRVDRATMWPILTGQLNANLAPETAFNDRVFSWSLSVFATWTLYDAGTRRIARRDTEYELLQEETRREQSRQEVEADARQVWLEVQQSITDIERTTSQVEFAERNVWLTNESFQLGAATSLDIQVAQQQLYLAQLADADAQVTLLQRLYRLYRIVGLTDS